MNRECSITLYHRLYSKLLLLYPRNYQKKFANSMMQTFNDLYNEKASKHKAKVVAFAFIETLMSIAKEQATLITNNNSLKQNSLAILGFLLLVPFGAVVALGMVWQFLHTLGYATLPDIGVLVPNRELGFALVFTFPAIAFLLNFGTLVIGAARVGLRRALSMQFVRVYLAPLTIVVLSMGATLFAFGHDTIPCFIHGVLQQGVGNIWPLIQLCANA